MAPRITAVAPRLDTRAMDDKELRMSSAAVRKVIALASELSDDERRVVVDAITPKESLASLLQNGRRKLFAEPNGSGRGNRKASALSICTAVLAALGVLSCAETPRSSGVPPGAASHQRPAGALPATQSALQAAVGAPRPSGTVPTAGPKVERSVNESVGDSSDAEGDAMRARTNRSLSPATKDLTFVEGRVDGTLVLDRYAWDGKTRASAPTCRRRPSRTT